MELNAARTASPPHHPRCFTTGVTTTALSQPTTPPLASTCCSPLSRPPPAALRCPRRPLSPPLRPRPPRPSRRLPRVCSLRPPPRRLPTSPRSTAPPPVPARRRCLSARPRPRPRPPRLPLSASRHPILCSDRSLQLSLPALLTGRCEYDASDTGLPPNRAGKSSHRSVTRSLSHHGRQSAMTWGRLTRPASPRVESLLCLPCRSPATA